MVTRLAALQNGRQHREPRGNNQRVFSSLQCSQALFQHPPVRIVFARIRKAERVISIFGALEGSG